jgi:hypothetical protein
MSNPTIRDEFQAHNGANKSTLDWVRTSPDVGGAEISAKVDVEGLPDEIRARYLIQIRQALAGLPGWGGGDY